MKSVARASTAAAILFLNACTGHAVESPDGDPSVTAKDSGTGSCTIADKSIISTSQTALTTCGTLESSSTTSLNALVADLDACVKAQADAGTCNTADIQKQITTLAAVGPSLKATACDTVTALGKLTASQTATLKTDATSDFATTCTYATDLVSIEQQLAALFTTVADAGVSDAGVGDGGSTGTYYAQLKVIATLAQDAYALEQKLPTLNATVQTDIDAAKKTCGM